MNTLHLVGLRPFLCAAVVAFAGGVATVPENPADPQLVGGMGAGSELTMPIAADLLALRDLAATGKQHLPLRGTWLLGHHSLAQRTNTGIGARSFPCGINNLSLLLCGSVVFLVATMVASMTYMTLSRPKHSWDGEQDDKWSEVEKSSDLHRGEDPLSPNMVVPDDKKFLGVIPSVICRQKQQQTFEIRNYHQTLSLFAVRLADSDETPGIYIENLPTGSTCYGYLSTKELWTRPDVESPTLTIHRPYGRPFGTIQKVDSSSYSMRLRGRTPYITLSGDIRRHPIRVVSEPEKHLIAYTNQGSTSGEYEVHVMSGCDVALVLLSLFAIEKLEVPASDRSSARH